MEDRELVRRLAIMGQDTRLAILRALGRAAAGGVTQRALAAELAVEQNAASYHLRLFVDAGLVVADKRGREVFYRADADGIARVAAAVLELGGSAPDPA